jgi:hypothetical protein
VSHTSVLQAFVINAFQRRKLDYFIGGGNVAYCSGDGNCHAAYSGNEKEGTNPLTSMGKPKYETYLNQALKLLPKPKLKFPNGLTRGLDGLFYVPSAIDGKIRVLALQPDNTLLLVDIITVGMPLDNISPDAHGDIYAAGFPNLYQSGKGFDDPYNEISSVTIWRIRKIVDVQKRKVNYRVEKVIEDKEGTVLSGSTTVRHDVKTGRLFVSGESKKWNVVWSDVLIQNSCSTSVPCDL